MNIDITSRFGGSDAWKAISDTVVTMNASLALFAKKPYKTLLRTASIFLYVSGDLDRFPGENGLSKFQVDRAKRKGRVLLTMHQDIWTAGVAKSRRFLHDNVVNAISQMLDRMNEQNHSSSKSELIDDLKATLKRS